MAKHSKHFSHHKFRNLEEAPVGKIPFSTWIKFIWGRLRQSQFTEIPPGHVLPKSTVIEQLTAAEGNSITWIGHACFLIRLEGKTILTDPFLTQRAGFWGLGPKRYVAPALSIEELPAIDFIILSHNHYDSLDMKTLMHLPNKDHTAVIVPLNAGQYFRKAGFQQVFELDWEQSITHDSIEFTALPAIHFSGRGLTDHNHTLWAGFAIKTHDYRIYFAGDTAYGALFNKINQLAGPFDLAIVGIGAYEPQSIMRRFHTTPEEAVKIAQDVQAKNVLAMHWGTIQLSEEPPFEAPIRFQEAAQKAGFSSDEAWVFKIGETRQLKNSAN